jgi:transcriptional regulator with XRE-family HTH domain
MPKSVFANNLVKIRNFYDLSQQQAAERIGIHRHNLAAYEEGRAEPCYAVLFKICRAYKIERVESLLWNEEFLDIKRTDVLSEFLEKPFESRLLRAYEKAKKKDKEVVELVLGLR